MPLKLTGGPDDRTRGGSTLEHESADDPALLAKGARSLRTPRRPSGFHRVALQLADSVTTWIDAMGAVAAARPELLPRAHIRTARTVHARRPRLP